MHKIGVGVIGMGWMGTVHGRSYRAVADRFHDEGVSARLVICADDVEARAQEAQERLGFEHYTTNWREVVSHPDVQVVNIAAPNFLHQEMALAAITAQKHVFCEKPAGRTPEETAAIFDAAQKAGVLSFVGLNYRWVPLVQFARQLIQAGKLGEITHYRGRFFAMYASNPLSQLSWRFRYDQSGTGILGDVMAHVVDMAQFLSGPIERVASNKHTFITERPLPVPGRGTHFTTGLPEDPTGKVTNEDYVGTLMRFKNGAQGTLEVSRTILGPKTEMAFEINGTRGALKWNFETMNELQAYLPDGKKEHDGFVRILAGPDHPFYQRFNPGPANSMAYEDLKVIEAYHVLKSVVDGQQYEPSLEQAYSYAKVNAAMIRSWKSGTWEEVRPLL